MVNYDKKTDAELVKLTLEDQEMFLHLMNRYEQKLLRYIRRFSGLNQESAEDALQETFIKIYRNLNDFDPTFSFSSWVYRIAHNETVNYLRKANRQKTVALETNEEDAKQLIDVLESDVDVVSEATKKELGENVRKALTTLPEHYREVLVLRYLEDLDYKEISDILKKPMGTIATLLNRAKKQFKDVALKFNLPVYAAT